MSGAAVSLMPALSWGLSTVALLDWTGLVKKRQKCEKSWVSSGRRTE
jgi:hypothetical protein